MAVEPARKVAAAADASFLIGLSAIGQVGLLEAMFDQVFVARAVWDEVVTRGQGRPGAASIAAVSNIQLHSVQNRKTAEMLALFLGAGEAETLALYQEAGCDLVLMDDLRGRKTAARAGIPVLGVVGLLLDAKRRGLIDRVELHLQALRAAGFRLGRRLIEEALRDAGES